MAGVRVELLLVVLTGTLVLAPVWGWEPINESELDFYESGQWNEQQSVTMPDDGSDFDDDEDADPEVEDDATGDDFDPFADHGFQVDEEEPENWASNTEGGFQMEFVDSPSGSWTSDTDDGFEMEFVDAPPGSWSRSTSQSSTDLYVLCSDDGFQFTLPPGLLSEVKVLGLKGLLSVVNAPPSCGYKVNSFKNTVTIPFTGCNVKLVSNCNANSYSLQLLYVNEFGQTQVTMASCGRKLGPEASDQQKAQCPNPTSAPPTSKPSKGQNCAVSAEEQVTCGQWGMSSSDCEKMGCCFDSATFTCHYPLDECTADKHFVFAIRYNSASIAVDPTKLVIPGDTSCKPVIVNDKVAIFKFKVSECAARTYEVGETQIYLAEVQSIVQTLNLKYGIITRSDPLRFMIECRYSKSGAPQKSLASVGYMVKTPTSNLPSSIISKGLYGVELRIAKDETYSSYLPTYHQPLRLLLGSPVYLELLLKSPTPDAVILVNYCLAYPRSAKNALVLVYEGCSNPNDPSVSVLQVSNLSKNRYKRRFVVRAFQFMDQKTNKYLDEEIYFMCSTEVCRPTEKTCEERCFDGKTP